MKGKRPDFSVFVGFDDPPVQRARPWRRRDDLGRRRLFLELTIDIYRAFKAGDLNKAVELGWRLIHLLRLCKFDSPFGDVVKEAIRLL